MSTPLKFVTAASVLAPPAFDLHEQPVRWPCPPPFELLDLRPGRVILLGAPPAAGKTTLALQLVTDVVAHQPNLRAVVANVEMAAIALTEKMCARLARVDIAASQERKLLPAERRSVNECVADNKGLFERIAFLEAPFTLAHLGQALRAFSARLAVIDYVQRFGTGAGDERSRLDNLMRGVREVAAAGVCVVLISAVSRQKSQRGSSSYTDLNMASFRGSSEIEFGADAAYLLLTDVRSGVSVLKCEKDRFRQPRDIHLRFDGACQTFSTGDPLDAFEAAPDTKPSHSRRGDGRA